MFYFPFKRGNRRDILFKNMSEPLNICMSCGLCCDGTLIGFVTLNREEIPAIKQIMEIDEVDGHGFFLQPCKKYCDGCTIYANRPKNCDKFNCELLKSAEQKELEFDSALEIINVVKQKKVVIEKMIAILKIELKSLSFYYKIVELKKVLQKIKPDSSRTPTHLELLSELQELDNVLLKNFGVSMN